MMAKKLLAIICQTPFSILW